ncbi:MAG: UDP-N-acetylmuramoyl-L-alanine--D-glutamate ligase [Patulibacter sp.]
MSGPLRFRDLAGRRVAVWGAGVETRSFARHFASRFPRQRLAALIVEDGADPATLDEPQLLGLADEVVEAGAITAALAGVTRPAALRHVGPRDRGLAGGVDVLVRSPGVSIYRPEVAALRAAGAQTATPTGLWLAERGGRNVIGVTATKGKSTTASLIAHLARAAGQTAHLAGNIGEPALDLLGLPDEQLVVLELSSYQIADLSCGPQTALAANLYREHLTWHLTEAQYAADKLRLLALPGVEHCVRGAHAAAVMAAPTAPAATVTEFGQHSGWHVTDEGVAYGDRLLVTTGALPLPGAHNALNLCGALAALDAHGIERPPLPQALDGFVALPHRLQLVHECDGISWVDDSISTTTESAIVALDSFPGCPIVLVGGGTDRGQDYAALGAALADRDAALVTVGPTGPRLRDAALAAGVSPQRAVAAADLPAAVAAARALAQPGGVVLLSPAAPSFYAYRDFKARGEHFRALAAGDR